MVTRITIDGYYQCNIADPPNWTVLLYGSFPYQTSPGLIYQWTSCPDKDIPQSIKDQRNKLLRRLK